MAGLLVGGCKTPAATNLGRAVPYGRRPLAVARCWGLRSPGLTSRESCGGRRMPSLIKTAAEKTAHGQQTTGNEEMKEAVEGAEVVMEEQPVEGAMGVPEGGEEGNGGADGESYKEKEEEKAEGATLEAVVQLDSLVQKAKETATDGMLQEAVLDELVAAAKEQVVGMANDLTTAQETIAGLEKDAMDGNEKYLRLNADFDNVKKRMAAEIVRSKESSTAEIVALLLPVLDNFELARGSINPGSEEGAKINDSYQGIFKQIVDILKGLGVSSIKTEGQYFDPEMHDAVLQDTESQLPDGAITRELRKGFKLNDQLLRPAMVQVSVQSTPGPSDNENNQAEMGKEGQGSQGIQQPTENIPNPVQGDGQNYGGGDAKPSV